VIDDTIHDWELVACDERLREFAIDDNDGPRFRTRSHLHMARPSHRSKRHSQSDNTSTARGKASIVVEAGYAGIVEADDITLLVDGTISTMRALKMLSGNSSAHRESRLAR
jgi:hypothetical protein